MNRTNEYIIKCGDVDRSSPPHVVETDGIRTSGISPEKIGCFRWKEDRYLTVSKRPTFSRFISCLCVVVVTVLSWMFMLYWIPCFGEGYSI
jgi:hypothetical protein